jgi:hypothetical protein
LSGSSCGCTYTGVNTMVEVLQRPCKIPLFFPLGNASIYETNVQS